MSVRIVQDVPAGRLPWQRLSRLVLSLLGGVLVVVGLLAAVWPVLLLVIVIDTTVRNGSLKVTGSDWAGTAAAAAVALLALWLGIKLIRGRRKLGLYLRKFGFADTTRIVSQALKSAVGRSVRLVTLDDSQTAPVGVGAGRWVASLVRLAALGLVAWLLFYLFAGGFNADRDRIINDTINQASDTSGNNPFDQLGATIGGAMVGGLVAGLLLIFTLALAIIIGLVGIVAYRAHRSARLAQRQATQALAQRQHVDGVARRLNAVARKVFAPRLMVVTVPESFWQEAIKGFAAVSTVAIIDVSHPTDPLIWEVANLRPLLRGRLIFVGAQELVAGLARPPHEIAGTPQGALAQLLDGEEIIAYGSTAEGRRRFTTALRRRLANIRPAATVS